MSDTKPATDEQIAAWGPRVYSGREWMIDALIARIDAERIRADDQGALRGAACAANETYEKRIAELEAEPRRLRGLLIRLADLLGGAESSGTEAEEIQPAAEMVILLRRERDEVRALVTDLNVWMCDERPPGNAVSPKRLGKVATVAARLEIEALDKRVDELERRLGMAVELAGVHRYTNLPPDATPTGSLCMLCDSMSGCAHPRVKCAGCGTAGLKENWPFRCCNVSEAGA